MSSFLRSLGWGHRGFTASSSRQAALGLFVLLAIPAAIDLGLTLKGTRNYPDLQLWHTTAVDFFRNPHQPLYDRHTEYLYPPFFLTLMWPLAQIGATPAAVIFELLKWAALFTSCRCAWRLASRPGEDLPPIVTLGSLLLTARFIGNDLGHSNVNLFLLALVLGGALLAVSGREYSAGVLIGLATCVKITPALLLVYLLYRRQWRPAVMAVATGLVMMLFWPALCFGWDANWQALQDWRRHVPGSFLHATSLWSPPVNQSLPAVLNRLFGGIAVSPADVDVTLAVLPGWAMELLRVAVAAVVLIALLLACRRRAAGAREQWAYATDIALVQIAMLLLSGFTWKAHFVAMLLPNTVLLAWLADARCWASESPRRMRPLVGGLLVASFVLGTLTTDLLGRRAGMYALGYGFVALAAVAVGIALLVIRRRANSAKADKYC